LEFRAAWRSYSRPCKSFSLARHSSSAFGSLQRPQKLRIAKEKVKESPEKHSPNVLSSERLRISYRKLPHLNLALRVAPVREDPTERRSSQKILYPERRTEEDPRNKDRARGQAEAVHRRNKRTVPFVDCAVLFPRVLADPAEKARGLVITGIIQPRI